MQAIKRTLEQEKIVEAVKRGENKIKIKAYAGTGKTTTLLEIVKENPDKNFLLLAFNKSVAEEIKKKQKKAKVSNLTVYTLHGLAYNYLFIANGRYKNGKPQLLATRMGEIVQSVVENLEEKLLEIWGYNTTPSFYTFLISAFNIMLSSPYAPNPDFSLAQFFKQLEFHRDVKFWYKVAQKDFLKTYKEETGTNFDEKLIETINLLWEETKKSIEEDRKREKDLEGRIKYSHEAYIKYFHYLLAKGKIQLKKPRTGEKFDYILLDEAQDVNGVQIGILNATKEKKIIVGDPHQNIYAWRGAINTFNYYKDWKEYALSISFRFNNSRIVDYANLIIQTIKGEKTPLKSQGKEEKPKTIGFLSRSNAGLVLFLYKLMKLEEGDIDIEKFSEDLITEGSLEGLKELLEKIKEKSFKKKGELELKLLRSFNEIFMPIWIAKKFVESLGDFNACLELVKQYLPKYIYTFLEQNPQLLNEYFSSIDELIEFFEEFREEDLRIATKIIKKLGLNKINRVYSWAKGKFERGTLKEKGKGKGSIVLSTIHTAKGLEWDYVILAEDISTPSELVANWILSEYGENIGVLINAVKRNEIIEETLRGVKKLETRYNDLIEELNLLYVALTRAKKELYSSDEYFLKELLNIEKGGIDYIKATAHTIIENELRKQFAELI